MSEQDNIQKLQYLYAAFGRGDIATILQNTSTDIDWGTETSATDVPWYPLRHGRDGVGDFFATLQREVEFTRFEPALFAGSGDKVLVHVEIQYRIRKNGQSASTGSIHEFSMKDGIVTRFRAFEDTATVQKAWQAA
jgi:ketosteroid isomerase-like protein